MKNDTDDISTSGFIQNSEYKVSGHFTEYSEIAAKGYCRLFKAQRQGQWFVLKALKPEFAHDPVYQGLFEKEYNLMLQLNHPNIVRIYSKENDEIAGTCMVMEYVDGRTLDKFIAENPSQNVRKEVAKQLLDAIGYCHSKQITHRDLKPSNILITHNGNHAKLIDFGLSDSDSYAVLKDPAYTKAYAAPEQLAGENVDCRADLYAFGLILRLLFPYCYGRVARKCMQSQREKRYASAAEVAKAIKICDSRRKKAPWLFVVLIVVAAIAVAFLLSRHQSEQADNSKSVYPAKTDTVFLANSISDKSPNISQTNEPSVSTTINNSENQVFNSSSSFISGREDNPTIDARNQTYLQEQEALDNAFYNFKFTVDSCFKPVDQYVKSNEVKTSNILRDLIYIAEYKSKIRECQIRNQLPKFIRNSFFNFANNLIEMKINSYTQDYPPIPYSAAEQQIQNVEIYQPIWEQSQRYQEEGRQLHIKWKKLMRTVK